MPRVSERKHGTRSRYTAGCRCDDCREAQKHYHREYMKRRGGTPLREQRKSTQIRQLVDQGTQSAIDSIESDQPPVIGRVEAAIKAELDELANAVARPGLYETALALARMLDSAESMYQKPAAAGKLVDILRELRKGDGGARSRLAAVRAMTAGEQTG